MVHGKLGQLLCESTMDVDFQMGGCLYYLLGEGVLGEGKVNTLFV